MNPTTIAQEAPRGARGFDCNTTVDFLTAQKFVRAGFRFACRYIPRLDAAPHDLTGTEFRSLLSAGLAVMPVQHVKSAESWVPNVELGRAYGATAAISCVHIGVPQTTTVWCDLEGVAIGTPHADVDAYCRAWHKEVSKLGYLPGLYVGWRSGLTPLELYQLPFTRYWAAYNLNRDQEPALVGCCMRQLEDVEHRQRPPGVAFNIDLNTVVADKRGRVPMMAVAYAAVPG